MNVELLFGFATILVALILIGRAFALRSSEAKPENGAARPPRPMRRAAGGARNARRRMRAGSPVGEEPVENAPSDEEEPVLEGKSGDLGDVKLGAKKRAKLEAKAERRVAREAAEREREERKRKELLSNEENEKRREREREEELGREEAERQAREEKERRERDEYLKMKEAFSVEEEGFNAQETETENLLREFVDHAKRSKVVILEDLAGHFGLKTSSVVERIRELRTNGTLTGVIDDRGKFIYVSPKELEDVARFVRQRGRVSIAELAENSNRLIDLNSGTNPEISVGD